MDSTTDQPGPQWWSGKRIVTMGGGTGPFHLLTSLKRYPCSISAIVTMADSGGSSRRLMDEFGQLPFGDLRQALVALSRKGVLWRDVFTFRFRQGQGMRDGDGLESERGEPSQATRVAAAAGVGGHSLGNLIISALQEINEGNLLLAIKDAQELLDTAGDVFPVTLDHATLCAEIERDATICGETEIDTRGARHPGPLPPIHRLFLQQPASACPDAIRAIRRADTIILGPGDLYTSILPNLLVGGVADAIRASDAEKIYVCNLMTKHGETDGFHASDFVREVHHYLGGRVDRVILHDGEFPAPLLSAYAEQQQYPVVPDLAVVRELVPHVEMAHLLASGHDHFVRHDPERLVRAAFTPRLDEA
ncbi:MAG TPA: gluconeogenesis factor YvcK family protein [Ktedonobacterales bacterium]|nr:gluconeogenesis factor YvcK family protein [Ktedonobacterales bacterium]